MSARRAGSELSKPTTRVTGGAGRASRDRPAWARQLWRAREGRVQAARVQDRPGQRSGTTGPARRCPAWPERQPAPAGAVDPDQADEAPPAPMRSGPTGAGRWHGRRSRPRCGRRRPPTPSGRTGSSTRRKPGPKLARLAGPPLTGIPNTMNTSTATVTSGGQIRPSTAVGRPRPGRTARQRRRSRRSCPARRCRPRPPPTTTPMTTATATGAATGQRGPGPAEGQRRPEPAARLGISTARTTKNDDSASVSPGSGGTTSATTR